ncbi:hypothetical protein Scep_000741 [Stephania cephalantha]|uniref:Uncharacterized protein n=1 Tax=Stephania cephalantha TaxID=152367 RepID=A0AAP0Q370_9MAGN
MRMSEFEVDLSFSCLFSLSLSLGGTLAKGPGEPQIVLIVSEYVLADASVKSGQVFM